MKIKLENEFTWDGIYNIIDEHGKTLYTVDARVEPDGRVIDLLEAGGAKVIATIRQKKHAKRPEYELSCYGQKIGTIARRGSDYDISYLDWFVSGNLTYWDFRVVDKYGDIAESWVVDNCLAFEVFDAEKFLPASILMLAIAGLAGDLAKEFAGEKQGETDIHDVIDTMENIAGKAGRFGRRTWAALEKLYGLDRYNNPNDVKPEPLV